MRHLLKTRVEVWKKSDASGEWGDTGEASEAYRTFGHLDPRSASEVYTKDQKVRVRTHTLYLDLELMGEGNTIDEKDFVVVNGFRFEVLGIKDYQPHHLELDLELIR